MKTKLKFITSVLLLVFNLIQPLNTAYAQKLPDCEFTGTDPLEFYANNFNSLAEIESKEVTFECVENCGDFFPWLWKLIKGKQSVSFKDNTIWQEDDGTYSTGLLIYDWDAEVLETVEDCMHPKIPDLLMANPTCELSILAGAIIGIGTAGFTVPMTVAVIGGAGCTTELFSEDIQRAAKDCEPKFKAIVKDHCEIYFGYDVLPHPGYTPVFNACRHISDYSLREECINCMGQEGEGSSGGVWTGLGCLKFSPTELVKQILQIAVGLGGGIAFLLLIYGAFLMTTSAGDPKAADNAKQIITGAITGLLIIIFSVVILNIIGVQILQIPGL